MAKMSAKTMAPVKPMPMMGATGAHGMSLTAKPARHPHPVHPGRDQFGRMLPGQLMANAAPPFQSMQPGPVVPPPPPAPPRPKKPAPAPKRPMPKMRG